MNRRKLQFRTPIYSYFLLLVFSFVPLFSALAVVPPRQLLPTGAFSELPAADSMWQQGKSDPSILLYEGSLESPTVDVALLLGIPIYLFTLQDKLSALFSIRGGGLFRLWLTPGGSSFNFGYFDGIFGGEFTLHSPWLKTLFDNVVSPYMHLGVTHFSSHLGDAIDEKRYSDSREKIWIQQDLLFHLPHLTAKLFGGFSHYFNATRLPLEEERWGGSELLVLPNAKLNPFISYSFIEQRVHSFYPASENLKLMSRLHSPEQLTHSLQGGVRLWKKLDFFLHYYEGNSPYGQLYGIHESFFGLGVRYHPFNN